MLDKRRIELVGWSIFLLSAFAFTAAALLAGDFSGLAGSLLFLLGCLWFMAPLMRSGSAKPSDRPGALPATRDKGSCPCCGGALERETNE